MNPSWQLHFPQFASLQRAAQIIDQIRENLDLMRSVQPYANARFQLYLNEGDLGPAERKSVKAIVLGSVLDSIAGCNPNETVLEEIEYQARRLAKLQVNPSAIHEALSQFDSGLLDEVQRRLPESLFVARTIVNHYHLFVTNVINVTLYQLWRADSKLLEDMSAIELAELSQHDLKARIVFLVKCWSGADAVAIHPVPNGTSPSPDRTEPEAAHGEPEKAHAGPQQSGCPAIPETGFESSTRAYERAQRLGPLGTPTYMPLTRPLGIRVQPDDQRILATRWRTCLRSVWSFPIQVGSRLMGILQLGFTRTYDWLPSEEAVLLRVAERLGLALTRCELVDGLSSRETELRQLANHLQQVEERERKRISRELHDEAGQSLLCLRLQLEMLENSLSKRQDDTRVEIRRAREQVETIIVEIRRLISALSPTVLEQFGLVAGIRHLLKDFLRVSDARVELEIDLPHDVRISPGVSMVTYRFVQEAIHNILSHSRARTVKIAATLSDGSIMWRVADDGVGFHLAEVQKRQGSYGLRGISERVLLLGGTVNIKSAPGQGTVVTAWMPLTADPAMPGLAALASVTRVYESMRDINAELPASGVATVKSGDAPRADHAVDR